MLFRTNVAISHLGERIAKGVEIEMDEKVAKNLGDDVVAVDGVVAEEPEETTEEKALADMTKAELAAKAEELELSASGSKADLVERITLHLEGADAEEETED